MRKQHGSVYRAGDYWVLRHRENIIENGQLVRRQLATKIDRVLPEHRRLKRPPPEIIKRAEQMLAPLNAGGYDPQATQTLVEYVERKFFPDMESKIRPSTLCGYRRRWETQLKARCGSIRLRDFKTVHGQQILDEVARQNPNLLSSTLHHLKSLLSAFFTNAIGLGILDGELTISGTRKTVYGNPMRSVRIPNAPEGEDTYAYSLPEIVQILTHLPEPARTICAIAGLAGLRRSELAGLTWESYDGTQLKVLRGIWEGIASEPKTRASKRAVPVIPVLKRILDAYRQQCGNPESGPMLANRKGRPANLNNLLNRSILPALRKAGIEWHGWHAFRRGLGSNLAELGVDELTIQKILRHSNVATTRQHYIKVRDPKVEAAMQLLDSKLLESELFVNCSQIGEPRVN